MNERALKTLEDYKIIERLASQAGSSLGREKCKNLLPSSNLEEIRTMQKETSDALARILQKGSLSFSGIPDIRASIMRLKVGGTLGPEELLRISSLLTAALRAKSYGSRGEEVEADSLSERFEMLEPLSPVNNEIRRCIISEEEIADDASPALKSIRRAIRAANDRIREELSLPRELPNILNIIWKKIRVGRLEWKPLDGKLGVQGELHIFVLYETMDEENPVQIYQTVVPFGASVECQGSTENAVLDVQTRLAHKELEIHADNDGEERMLGLEVVMDLGVVMYEQEALELLSDVYAVTRQIQTREREGCFNRLLSDVRGRQKLSGRARLTAPAGVRKILNLDGHIVCDHREIRDQGVGINGSVELELLYQTGDKEKPFASEKVSLPFDYTCEAPGLKPDGAYRMQYHIEDLDASMLDSEEAEVNAGIVFDLLAFDTRKEQIIEEITTRELDQETMNALPGMVIYVVQPGDSLWKIGKRYYVPVDVIKELNGLTGNDIYPGDKLLLMKHSPT